MTNQWFESFLSVNSGPMARPSHQHESFYGNLNSRFVQVEITLLFKFGFNTWLQTVFKTNNKGNVEWADLIIQRWRKMLRG
jgi:hypothetical protein